jgi:hypothetical protein
VAYWLEQLAGAPAQALPADRPRPGSAVACARGGWLDLAIPEATVAGLEALAGRAGATVFMVLLAGLQLLLSALSGLDDVVVRALAFFLYMHAHTCATQRLWLAMCFGLH